jgi:acyl dehydratase
VIANYGMDNLRFVEPVKIGDSIQVELTCKQKTPKPQKTRLSLRMALWYGILKSKTNAVNLSQLTTF